MLFSYKEFKQFCENLEYRPKLLLHACCGPCSTYSIELLKKYFDITVFYSNSNMDTIEEFEKRYNELIKVCNNSNLEAIKDEYIPEEYYEAVKGLEHLGEFSARCDSCMEFRMRHTALFAKENGFEYFTTTLSISPYKDSKSINRIGYELEQELRIKYLYSDFKKEDGYKKSVQISKDMDLYRQHYCGCVFSIEEAVNED